MVVLVIYDCINKILLWSYFRLSLIKFKFVHMSKYLLYRFVGQRDNIPFFPRRRACDWIGLFYVQRIASKMTHVSVRGLSNGRQTRDYNDTGQFGRRDFQTVNSRPLNGADANANRLMLIYSIFTLLSRHRGYATYFHCFTTMCQYWIAHSNGAIGIFTITLCA